MRNTYLWGYQTQPYGCMPLQNLGSLRKLISDCNAWPFVLMATRHRRRALTVHISRNNIGDAAGFNCRAGWARRNGFEVSRNIGLSRRCKPSVGLRQPICTSLLRLASTIPTSPSPGPTAWSARRPPLARSFSWFSDSDVERRPRLWPPCISRRAFQRLWFATCCVRRKHAFSTACATCRCIISGSTISARGPWC